MGKFADQLLARFAPGGADFSIPSLIPEEKKPVSTTPLVLAPQQAPAKATPIADKFLSLFAPKAPAAATPAQTSKTPIADSFKARFDPVAKATTGSAVRDVGDFMERISATESSGDYSILGPVIKEGMYAGDRAYGKYQVMGKNIPEWTKQYLGVALTPEQFRASPASQDKLMAKRFEELYAKYGNWEDVASVHFTGRTRAQAGGTVKDQLGTTNDEYISKVLGTAPAAKPSGSWLDRMKATADTNVAAIQAKETPFIKALRAKTAEIANKVGGAADAFLADQAETVGGALTGAFKITPADVWEGTKDTFKGTGTVAKVLAQGFAEGVYRIGKSGIELLPGQQFAPKETIVAADIDGATAETMLAKDPELTVRDDGNGSYTLVKTQGDQITKFLTGKGRISTVQEISARADKYAKENGATPEEAGVFAGIAVLGTLFMDSPIGPGKFKGGLKLTDDAISTIAKNTDEGADAIIRDIIKKENPDLPDSVLDATIPAFRRATTPQEVAAVADTIGAGARAAESASAEKAAAVADEVSEAAKNVRATVFHGTKGDIDDITKSAPLSYGDPQALYGPGTYLTDSQTIAEGYAKTKGVGEGKVLSGDLREDLKFLDLDGKLSDAERKEFEDALNASVGDFEKGADTFPVNITGAEAVQRIRENLAEAGATKAEAAEIFHMLQQNLGETHGYDGFAHVGGVGKGTPHNVKILFDYGNAEKPIASKFAKSNGIVPTVKADAPEPEKPASRGTKDVAQLERMLTKEQTSLNIAKGDPEAHVRAYGRNKIPEYEARIASLKERIAAAKEAGPAAKDTPARKPTASGKVYVPDVNMVKRIAATNDKYEVLGLLTKEFTHLPERIKDTFVDKLAKLKRTSDIEGVLKTAGRLNRTPLPKTKLKADTRALVEKTLPRSVAEVMSDSEKIAYINNITRKADTPEQAVLAQSEYEMLMEGADQKVIDEFNAITMERDILEDVIGNDESASVLYNRYYRYSRSMDAGDIIFGLDQLNASAVRKSAARRQWNRGAGATRKPPKLTPREEKALRLDTEIEELGFKDFDEAQEAVETFIRTKQRVKELDEKIREMRPIVRGAELLRGILDDVPVVLSAEVDKLDEIINSATTRGSFKDIGNTRTFDRDLYRNSKRFFGSYYDGFKKAILDPFDDGKGAFVKEINAARTALKENVSKLGFKRKSKESEWIQRLFDTDLPEGWRRTPEEAIEEFGEETYQKMVEADKFFRGKYDEFIDRVNEVRAEMYPNNPSKLVGKQSNYYRHFREMDSQFGEALRAFFDTPAGIDPKLVGQSEFTQPKSKFASFAQERLGQETDLDAIGGFIDYVPTFAYSVHIDPHIGAFRYVARKLAEVSPVKNSQVPVLNEYGAPTGLTERVSGADNYLQFLTHFANDLAGKTNPADRFLQEWIPGGRATFRAIDWLNNRIKANQILGNQGTGIAQLANLPLGLASTGPKAFTRGMARTIAGIGRAPGRYQELSNFLPERYLESLKDDFPVSFTENKIRRIGDEGSQALGWILRTLDRVGTDTIWNAHLEEYLAKNMRKVDGQEIWADGADPKAAARYADEKTRGLVGGRGIGEVPLLQKSKTFQMVAPFTLEVENFWHVIDDWTREYYKGAGNRNLTAVATLLLANYAYNEFAERSRGSRVVFDPINAAIDGWEISGEELEKGNVVGAATKPLFRVLGELLSNKAIGQPVASLFPEEMRKDLFGEQDPTRFGIGFPIPAAVGKVLQSGYDAATGQWEWPSTKEFIKSLLTVVPRYGGKQIEKSWEGIEAMLGGMVVGNDGKKSFEVQQTLGNWIKSVLFGQYATEDARQFFEERTDLFRRIDDRDDLRAEQLAAAEKEWARLKKVEEVGGAAAANAAYAQLKDEKPQLAKHVREVGQLEKQGLGDIDRLIKMLGVEDGSRAYFIVEKLQDLETVEERNAYAKELQDKKLLPKKVKDQIRFIWEQGGYE